MEQVHAAAQRFQPPYLRQHVLAGRPELQSTAWLWSAFISLRPAQKCCIYHRLMSSRQMQTTPCPCTRKRSETLIAYPALSPNHTSLPGGVDDSVVHDGIRLAALSPHLLKGPQGSAPLAPLLVGADEGGVGHHIWSASLAVHLLKHLGSFAPLHACAGAGVSHSGGGYMTVTRYVVLGIRAPLYVCMQGGCKLVTGDPRQRQISSSVPLPACIDMSALGLLVKGLSMRAAGCSAHGLLIT